MNTKIDQEWENEQVLRAKHPNQGKKVLGGYLNRGRECEAQKSKWQANARGLSNRMGNIESGTQSSKTELLNRRPIHVVPGDKAGTPIKDGLKC